MDRVVLSEGRPRLGSVWFSSNHSERPAMVWNSGRHIELVVNFHSGDEEERRLIGRNVSWADDPSFSRFDYDAPQQVWFADPHGVLVLVDPVGRLNRFSAWQECRLRYQYAFEAGSFFTDYRRIHGMRTRLEGLEQWIPVGSIDFRSGQESGDGDSFTIRNVKPIPVAPVLNATIRPTYSYLSSSEPGKTWIGDHVDVCSGVQRARPWREHLDVHLAVRELLIVAGWRDFSLYDMRVQRRDDPERALAGNPLAQRWTKVSTFEIGQGPTLVGSSRFLFSFEDIPTGSLTKWFRTLGRYSDGVIAMTRSIGTVGVSTETGIAEAGLALERIGYGIAVERNESPGRHLETHLSRVRDSLTCRLPIKMESWPRRFADAYNTVKHPDRPAVLDSIGLANVLRESQLIFRCWVASRLKVPDSVLERNMSVLPMARPFERW